MSVIEFCIKNYYANANFIVPIGGDESADELPYASITRAKKRFGSVNNGKHPASSIKLVKAVYEWQNSPIMYLADGKGVSDEELQKLRNILAMRGDAPYLGVVSNDELKVYHIMLDNREISSTEFSPENLVYDHKILFSLLNRNLDVEKFQQNVITDVILDLMLNSVNNLNNYLSSMNESISLIGRMIFVRFLADRDLLPTKFSMFGRDSMSQIDFIKFVFDWLDEWGNYELFPIPQITIEDLPEEANQILCDILKKTPDNLIFRNFTKSWENLDFAHIRSEIFAQVFEKFLMEKCQSNWSPNTAQTTCQLVDLMVKASFEGLKTNSGNYQTKVLDPAFGSGIFLMAAFRELIIKKWNYLGQRPNAKEIRPILYEQIYGFDNCELSMKFATMGLYMIALELTPDPDRDKRIFLNKLQNNVLFHFYTNGNQKGSNIGSLIPKTSKVFRNKFDIVIGNLPWKTYFKNGAKTKKNIENEITSFRSKKELRIELPKRSLDLAFLWRSMEWAKEKGQISLLLHERFLFQHSLGMKEARVKILEHLNVKSLVNCNNFKNINFRHGKNTSGCILFAKNSEPGLGTIFKLFGTKFTKIINVNSKFIIDTVDSDMIFLDTIRKTPQSIKLNLIGTAEDYGVFERIQNNSIPLKILWNQLIDDRKTKIDKSRSGQGFSKRYFDTMLKTDKFDKECYEIEKPNFVSPLITHEMLDKTSIDAKTSANFPTKFRGPMLVVHKTPDSDKLRINASVCEIDAIYSEYIIGFSVFGLNHTKNKNLFLRFLCLVLRSKIAMWQILTMSGGYGTVHGIFDKNSLDNLYVPNFHNITDKQVQKITSLFNQLNEMCNSKKNTKKIYDRIDMLVADMYQISKRDIEIINETLEFNAPYKRCLNNAEKLVTDDTVEEFCELLKSELDPFAEHYDLKITIKNEKKIIDSYWKCILVCFSNEKNLILQNFKEFEEIFIQNINTTSSDEFLFPYSQNCLLIGRSSKKRIWKFSHAKLLASKIAWMDLGN